MAQFMDSSVSPIKMKIWGVGGQDRGGGVGGLSHHKKSEHMEGILRTRPIYSLI